MDGWAHTPRMVTSPKQLEELQRILEREHGRAFTLAETEEINDRLLRFVSCVLAAKLSEKQAEEATL